MEKKNKKNKKNKKKASPHLDCCSQLGFLVLCVVRKATCVEAAAVAVCKARPAAAATAAARCSTVSVALRRVV